MYTFGQLKQSLRKRIFPAGEPDNLVTPHDDLFVDAIIDLQRVVPCLQRDNTDLFQQCSTLYNCGVTVFDAPRGNVMRLSVVDKINPDTRTEDAAADTDYCAEIEYVQVSAVKIHDYIRRSRLCGACLPPGLFFGLSGCNSCYSFPIPTGDDLPAGLPVLPLGYAYPDSSTDRVWGRAGAGVWAIERGKILVAPWIQSTETVVVTWDGIKRKWVDADAIDDDPELAEAIEEYVRWKNAGKYDRDQQEEQRAAGAYLSARQMLWHTCREETRVRDGKDVSQARASSVGISALYFNEEQSATASCPSNQDGSPVTITIPAGTVGSNISVADANKKALQQAQVQAEAQLVCTEKPVTYWNTAQTATASCEGSAGAPTPVGNPVTVTIPANTVSSEVSQAAADAAAYSQALSTARSRLECVYGNAPQTSTCQYDAEISYTVPANTFQSTISQADADAKALAEASSQVAQNPDCYDPGDPSDLATNSEQRAFATWTGCGQAWQIMVTVPAGTFTERTQLAANDAALQEGQRYANMIAAEYQATVGSNPNLCGNKNFRYGSTPA